MKIQLDASALSKLIELNGGEEFILELSTGVIENVCKRYVKALVNKEAMEKFKSEAGEYVKREIGTSRNTWKRDPDFDVAGPLKKKIEEEVSKHVKETRDNIDAIVSSKAREIMNSLDIDSIVRPYVVRAMSKHVKEVVEVSAAELLKNVKIEYNGDNV